MSTRVINFFRSIERALFGLLLFMVATAWLWVAACVLVGCKGTVPGVGGDVRFSVVDVEIASFRDWDDSVQDETVEEAEPAKTFKRSWEMPKGATGRPPATPQGGKGRTN